MKLIILKMVAVSFSAFTLSLFVLYAASFAIATRTTDSSSGNYYPAAEEESADWSDPGAEVFLDLVSI